MLTGTTRNTILVLAALCLFAGRGLAARVDPVSASAATDLSVRARLATHGLTLESGRDILSAAAEGGPVGGGATLGGGDRKNPMVALLMSLVLPGWGELYTGHTARAKAFMATEAAIWVGYAAFTVQGGMREDDYREYASLYAGLQDGGNSSGYYGDIADYIRSEGYDSYNEAIRADARSLFPDDLEAQEQYVTANGYFGGDSWEWESEARFDAYRDLRHEASVSTRNAFYMTGLAVLNRALSAVDSAWMARRYNTSRQGEPSVRFSVAPELGEDSCGGRAMLEITY